jgi:protein TonB
VCFGLTPKTAASCGVLNQNTANNGEGETAQVLSTTALTGDYIKHNFNYISRRIRDCLIYPTQAKKTGIQGTVKIIFTIEKDGSASSIAVGTSSGNSNLDAAAVNSVKAASPFKAPPAVVRLSVPVVFSLR